MNEHDSVPIERPTLRQLLFGQPHLPRTLVSTSLIIIFATALLILIGQRDVYWHDYTFGAIGQHWLDRLIQAGPYLFLAAFLGYAIVIYILLRSLAYKIALMIWTAVIFIHMRDVVVWAKCGLWRLFAFSESSCYLVDIGLAISLSMIVGLILATTLQPVERPAMSATRSRLLFSTRIITIVSFLLLLTWLGWNIFKPIDGWLPVAAINPPPERTYGAIAYDAEREVAVLFGGGSQWHGSNWYAWNTMNDTWEWNGKNWTAKFGPTTPPARIAHQMAYDPLRQVTVLFGGQEDEQTLGDTWEWNGSQWQERRSETVPPPRCCHIMFFDLERGRVILAGGLQTPNFFLNDVWEWDGQNWHDITNQSTYFSASGYPAAYNSNENYALALLGSETWRWQNGSWTNLLPSH